jgi:hypothetical protein
LPPTSAALDRHFWGQARCVNAGEEEMMKSANTQDTARNPSEQGELVRRYHEIGISAVAAALAYGTDKNKKSAPAPVERRIRERELQVSA